MRDRTFRYSLFASTKTGYMTPSGWPTRNASYERRPAIILGKPTAAKLAQFVADFNASLQPGEPNEYLGDGATIVAASIKDHYTDDVVADWRAA